MYSRLLTTALQERERRKKVKTKVEDSAHQVLPGAGDKNNHWYSQMNYIRYKLVMQCLTRGGVS